MSNEKLNKKIYWITASVANTFPVFGGGRGGGFNPLEEILKDKPPMFALGVDVRAVVEFVLREAKHGLEKSHELIEQQRDQAIRERDALAKALRLVIKAQRGVACQVHIPLRSPLCLHCQLDARSEEASEALAALENAAEAKEGRTKCRMKS